MMAGLRLHAWSLETTHESDERMSAGAGLSDDLLASAPRSIGMTPWQVMVRKKR